MPDRARSLEVCIDTLAGFAACQAHADRIELCSALALGGLSPGPGLLAAVKDSNVPVFAMVRPESGGFHYDRAVRRACCTEIEKARQAGCAGVVIGAARNGRLDADALKDFVAAAEDMDCTLHRVIDQLELPQEALDLAIDLGITRVLTSGGVPKAIDALPRLKEMQDHAAGRIAIMAGGGITADTIPLIASQTGIQHMHGSFARRVAARTMDVAFGFAAADMSFTDPAQIAQAKATLQAL